MSEPKLHPFDEGGFLVIGTDDVREAIGYVVEHYIDEGEAMDRDEAEVWAAELLAEVQFGKIVPSPLSVQEELGWSWLWKRDIGATSRPKGHSVAVVFTVDWEGKLAG